MRNFEVHSIVFVCIQFNVGELVEMHRSILQIDSFLIKKTYPKLFDTSFPGVDQLKTIFWSLKCSQIGQFHLETTTRWNLIWRDHTSNHKFWWKRWVQSNHSRRCCLTAASTYFSFHQELDRERIFRLRILIKTIRRHSIKLTVHYTQSWSMLICFA